MKNGAAGLRLRFLFDELDYYSSSLIVPIFFQLGMAS